MAQAPTDLFALHAQNNPDKPAIIEGDDVFTFAQVNGEVNRLVAGLRELGFKPGSVAAALQRAVRWYADNGYVSPHRAKKIAAARAA